MIAPHRARWAVLLAGAVLCAIAGSLPAMTNGLTSLLACGVVLVCAAAAWLATKRLRPWSTRSAWVVVIVVAIAFVSSMGMKSLWLGAFGERADGCVVTERQSHTPRRSPTYYWNELDCGSRRITYRPSSGHSTKPVGERIDLVVDRTGFGGHAEPDKIRPLTSALVGVAGLIGAGFVALVLWWPRPKPPVRRTEPKLTNDFL